MSDGMALNNNNVNNSSINKMDRNKDKIIKFKSSDFQNKSFSKKLSREVFIVTKEDYEYFIKLRKVYSNEDDDIDSFNSKTQLLFNQQITIISSLEEVENLIENKTEFFLLNKEYFKEMNYIQGANNVEGVIFFECINKKYLIFPKEKDKNNVLEISNGNICNLTQEHLLDINFINKDNNSSKNINIDEQNNELESKKIILKSSILLYAFEKYFIKLINEPIKDEYDINEYYLINKNWINYYKTYTYHQNLIKILDDKKLTFSYKGYCINLDEILEKIISNNNNNNILFYLKNIETSDKYIFNYLSKEENFIPLINGNIIDNNETKGFLEDFILVPENLFDLFFDRITAPKLSKEDYKYNALIGDKAVFIQSKQSDNIFYTYTLPDKNDCLVMSSILRYLKKNTFYNEVKEYIKGNGWYNYIFTRKLKYNPSSGFNEIKDGNNIIGNYKIYQLIDEKLIKEIKSLNLSNPFNKCKEIYKYYKEFISKLFNLKDNKIPISSSIIDITKIDYIPTFIVSQSDFEKYEKQLLFKELVILSKIKDNKSKYETYEKTLASKFNFESVSEDVRDHFYIQGHKKCNNKLNRIFCFFSKDLLLKINNEKKYYEFLEKQETFLFFINNNDYFVYSSEYKKLYNVIFQDDNKIAFKLKEFEFNLELNNIPQILKDLYQSEKRIEYYRDKNLSMKESLKVFNLYLINKEWMENYKNFYNYDSFIAKCKNGHRISLSIFKKEDLPYKLKYSQNLIPNNDNSMNCNAPKSFEIVEKDIFESIIKDINTRNNINLKMDQCYDVMLGDKKIFIRDNSNKNLYFIYSSAYNEYELEYIIVLKNIDLFNFIKNNSDKASFEEIISEFGIDLTDKNKQSIIDNNLNRVGMVTYIKPKANIVLKEPKHCLGLENIGATCYMNATIQCLCHISNFKKYFQNRQSVFKDTNNKDCRLTKEFYKLINSLWKDSYKGKNYFTPRDFKDTISEMNPLFQGIAANDSKDLIIFIYETIHNEINKPENYNENNNYNNDQTLRLFRNNYYSNNSSFLINTFYFEQQSEIKCLSCQYSKISYNIANIIIFPLEKVRQYMEKKNTGFISVTLDNCFENYQESEILFGANQIYCSSCKHLSNASTSNKIFTSPEVLTIILNRGKGLQFDVNFEYPLSLDIDKYITDKSKGNNKYELICVLTHLGPSGMSGHFIAFCKSPVDNHWYCYNDASVSKSNDPRYQNSDELEGIPYVLFYQKCNSNYKIYEKKNSNYNQENYGNKDKRYLNIFENEGKQENNSIGLYFIYNDKELFLSVDKDLKHNYYFIKALTKEYKYISSNILLLIQTGNEEMLNLEDYLRDNKLKDGDKIIVIDNTQ